MAKVEAFIGNHLDLPEFNVINRQESPSGDILYTVEPKEAPAKCPSCGGKLNIHKKVERKVKDLDEFGKQVGILVKGRSYLKCKMEFLKGSTTRKIIASLLALLLIAVGFALFIYFRDIQIDKQYTAMIVNTSGEFQTSEQRNIKITGALKKNLREFRYSGTINIEGYESPENKDGVILSLVLQESELAPKLLEGDLNYISPMLGIEECLGRVFVDSQFNVFFFEPNDRRGKLYAAPAKTPEQADKLAHVYFPQDSFVFITP